MSPFEVSRRAFSALVCSELASAVASADTQGPFGNGPSPALDRPTPLTQMFPRLAAALPRHKLATLPTPVTKADALAKALGLGGLYVKRDDLTAVPYGGGKPRKLEFFLGAAQHLGKRRLVTTGGVSSNHALATAIYARELGLGATLLLLPEPRSAHVRRRLLAEAQLGAELRLVPSQAAAERELARLGAPRGDAFAIPSGGSSALGNVGFVEAGLELGQQIRAGELPEPESVYVALGSMGTAVGLLIGFQLAQLGARLVAVRASSPGTSSAPRFARLYAQTVELLRTLDRSFPALSLPASQLRLEAGFLGRGYGQPTVAGAHALDVAAKTEALLLDSTYTAKALSALIHAASSHNDRPVLFWLSHAGREPSDSAAQAAVELPLEFRAYLARP